MSFYWWCGDPECCTPPPGERGCTEGEVNLTVEQKEMICLALRRLREAWYEAYNDAENVCKKELEMIREIFDELE